MQTPTNRSKRINREIEKGLGSEQFEFLDDVEGKYGDKNNCYLRFCVVDGSYAGQIQILQIKFIYGSGTVYKFPAKPPNVTFITPLYHANIYRGGAICLDILRPEKWSPMQDVDSVFTSLRLLMVEPNPSSPANGSAGSDFKKLNAAEFHAKARTFYLDGVKNSQKDSERKNTIALLTSDDFKTGMPDTTKRDEYRAGIMQVVMN
jgi:ubiquitin-protein ligase